MVHAPYFSYIFWYNLGLQVSLVCLLCIVGLFIPLLNLLLKFPTLVPGCQVFVSYIYVAFYFSRLLFRMADPNSSFALSNASAHGWRLEVRLGKRLVVDPGLFSFLFILVFL
jgi:hypothetical protein